MVACGLREKKKEATRVAILEVALDLFDRDGFEATTIEDITAVAGVSPRTFFRYFESKVDLVIERKDQSHHGELRDLIMQRPADEHPLEAMRQVAETALLASMADGGDVMLRQIKILMNTPSLRAIGLEHFNDHRSEIGEAFAARLGVDETALEPRVLAAVLPETLWVVIEEWLNQGADPSTLGGLIDRAFSVLYRGVTAAC